MNGLEQAVRLVTEDVEAALVMLPYCQRLIFPVRVIVLAWNSDQIFSTKFTASATEDFRGVMEESNEDLEFQSS